MFSVYLEASTDSKAGCVAGAERPPGAKWGISEGMGPRQGGVGDKSDLPLARDRDGSGLAINYANTL